MTTADLLHNLAQAARTALNELTTIHHYYLPKCEGGCPYEAAAKELHDQIEAAKHHLADPPVLPIIHRNGSGKAALVQLRCNAGRDLSTAIESLAEMGPNGRDYYPIAGLLKKAETQHQRRMDALRSLRDEILAEVIAIDELP